MEGSIFSFNAMKETHTQWVMHSNNVLFVGSQSLEACDLHMKINGVWKAFHLVGDSRDEMTFVRLSSDKEIEEWEYYLNFEEPELLEQLEIVYPSFSSVVLSEDDSIPF
jgi:hypothetical protein